MINNIYKTDHDFFLVMVLLAFSNIEFLHGIRCIIIIRIFVIKIRIFQDGPFYICIIYPKIFEMYIVMFKMNFSHACTGGQPTMMDLGLDLSRTQKRRRDKNKKKKKAEEVKN